MCVHFKHLVTYYKYFLKKFMPKNKEFDKDQPKRRRLFKTSSKGVFDENGYELSVRQSALGRKKIPETENSNIKTKRVSDLLNSLSKFDEDILRLKGFGMMTYESDDNTINELSIDEMQEQLRQILLERDRLKTNLENFIINTHQTSIELKDEEEKIRKFKKAILIKTEKQFSNLEDK